ncbi:MAG: hypothetical protein ACTS4U_01215 [Candidatus Hodgkinia cicadicola]
MTRGATYYNGIMFEEMSHFVCMTGRNRFIKVDSLGGGRYDGFHKTSHLRRSVGRSFGLSHANKLHQRLISPIPSVPRRIHAFVSLNQFNP